MKKTVFIGLTLIVIAVFASTPSKTASAAMSAEMIFLYPGEAGSTEEAAPVLELFFEFLNGKITPYKINGKYFNSRKDGLGYIDSKKPMLGIVSYPEFVQDKSKFDSAKVILLTLPWPHGESTIRYKLVGNKKTISKTIISSEPMTTDFVRTHLFTKVPGDAKIMRDDQILFSLKKISSGELNATAILTPTESYTLSKLSADWAKKLVVIDESLPVSSAKVLAFAKDWPGIKKVKDALLGMADDPEGRQILSELRLKGFTLPKSP